MVGATSGCMRKALPEGGYAHVQETAPTGDSPLAPPVHELITDFLKSRSGQAFLQLYSSVQPPTGVSPAKTPNAGLKGDASDPLASNNSPKGKQLKPTKANVALAPIVVSEAAFCCSELRKQAFYADNDTLIFNMDVNDALELLTQQKVFVNCILTSPPFYGQRDYEVDGQIGLEAHPSEFVGKLLATFDRCRPILAENGSLWVNLGDTYWSGKGEHKSGEVKQTARRFGVRPQDKKVMGNGASRSNCF